VDARKIADFVALQFAFRQNQLTLENYWQ